MIVVVNIILAVLVLLVIWWFWFSKPSEKHLKASDRFTIMVENGVYSPAVIKAAAGKPLHLTFIRKDKTPCSEFVIFNDFDISAQLPADKAHEIVLTPEKPGHYEFTCQMGMYRGELFVDRIN